MSVGLTLAAGYFPSTRLSGGSAEGEKDGTMRSMLPEVKMDVSNSA
jgi:hypothetical protein